MAVFFGLLGCLMGAGVFVLGLVGLRSRLIGLGMMNSLFVLVELKM